MPKLKVVVFDKDGYARIFINPGEEIKSLPGAFISPDESKVKGVAPEYWKVQGREIVPMTADEIADRDKDLASETVPSNVIYLEKLRETKVFKVPAWAYAAIAIEAAAVIVTLLVHRI